MVFFGELKLDVGRVDVDLGEIRCLAKTFEKCDFLTYLWKDWEWLGWWLAWRVF